MQVSSSTLRLALFRVFSKSGAGPDEGVAFSDIEQAWAGTGLRMSDLRDAIREMMERAWVRSAEEGDKLSFALTAMGYEQMARPEHTLAAAATRMQDSLTLLRAQSRTWLPSRPRKEQRRTDGKVNSAK